MVSRLNQAVYASLDDLLRIAVQANQRTHSGSSDSVIQSAWKSLPNMPTYQPAVAVLAGYLIAMGGKESPEGRADKKEVYFYSPCTNSWIYTSDLPVPRSFFVATTLSSAEVLVIGGSGVNTVYKSTWS